MIAYFTGKSKKAGKCFKFLNIEKFPRQTRFPRRFSQKERRGQPFDRPRSALLLQALLVGLDHLLDHLPTHRASLTAGQVAVVAFLQVHANLL